MPTPSLRRFLSLIAFTVLPVTAAMAQVSVNPTGVNVSSQGPTTVFLTFGGLTADLVPADAFWCGEVISAAPDIGTRCDPATMFGHLPLRFDLSRPSGTGALTDIMSIPASVARRAYQAAADGAPAAFFYVRRFRSQGGGPDVYVAVTCRLTSGGATTPFSLVDVTLVPASDAPVLVVEPGMPAPAFHAVLTYTGTGRLHGRWEVVLPGEDLPTEQDLLAESALPLELRGSQRRWMQLERFTVHLPPTGRAELPGPDPARLPRDADGAYLVLLRIEATGDRDGQSNLAAVGAGPGIVASGAVAGFPMPTLRYVVGSGAGAGGVESEDGLRLLVPGERERAGPPGQWRFGWAPHRNAATYRLEIAGPDGSLRFEALLEGGGAEYMPPPFLAERVGDGPLRWRVRAFDAQGREMVRSAWRALDLGEP